MIQHDGAELRGQAGEVGGRMERIRWLNIKLGKIGRFPCRWRPGWTKMVEDSRNNVLVKFAAGSTMVISAFLPELAEVIWEMSDNPHYKLTYMLFST